CDCFTRRRTLSSSPDCCGPRPRVSRAILREEAMREAHVPAEQPKAQEATRLPVPYAIPRRPGGAQGPPPARPRAPVGLIWRVRDRATFAALSRAERHVQGPVTVRVVPGEVEGPARVAYAVSGAGNAVARNRLRRRLRAAVGRAEADLA